jgi:lipopolysaccharide export system permease protein
MALILPFALFCAVLYALNRLYTESELVVIWAAGFSRWAVAGPVIVIAIATAGAAYAFNLYFMPAGMREMKDRVFEIRADLVNTFVREGAFTSPVDGLTVYVGERNGGQIKGILVHDARNPKSVATYMAQQGTLAQTPQGPRLIMDNGNVQWLEGGEGRLKILNFEKYTFDLGQFDKQRDTATRESSERFLDELLHPEANVTPAQRNKFFAEAHNRLSAPLYCLVFALIAVTALVGGTFNRRGYGGRIALSMVAVLAARLPGIALQRLVDANPKMVFIMYAWPAIWIIVLIALLSIPAFEMFRTRANGRGVQAPAR